MARLVRVVLQKCDPMTIVDCANAVGHIAKVTWAWWGVILNGKSGIDGRWVLQGGMRGCREGKYVSSGVNGTRS